MSWPLRALLGPGLWALAFAGIYAAHGAGCALDWPARTAPFGNLHQFTLVALWLATLAAGALILWLMPRGGGTGGWIARAGAWIGFAAILLTLFPVLGLTTCG